MSVTPELWMENGAPLPPTGLSHRPPVGATYILPFLGRLGRNGSGRGLPPALLCGMEQGALPG